MASVRFRSSGLAVIEAFWSKIILQAHRIYPASFLTSD
jgi:hypothetical protein